MVVQAKKDFYGKTVAEIIQSACQELGVPQEELNIEVVETGSNGIFGLIRKKAHIRVTVKKPSVDGYTEKPEVVKEQKVKKSLFGRKKSESSKKVQQVLKEDASDKNETEVHQVSQENLEFVRGSFDQLFNLMGYPSTIDLTTDGLSLHCQIESEYEDELTGRDGKTLDALQYLLRKMIARKSPDRIRLAVDVGDFRERRLEELRERAKELGEKVRNDGKTQVIPALNPSERRVVHMELQNEKGVKSRSVGEGLFKKVLIYTPGKKKRPGTQRRKSNRSKRRGTSRKRSS